MKIDVPVSIIRLPRGALHDSFPQLLELSCKFGVSLGERQSFLTLSMCISESTSQRHSVYDNLIILHRVMGGLPSFSAKRTGTGVRMKSRSLQLSVKAWNHSSGFSLLFDVFDLWILLHR